MSQKRDTGLQNGSLKGGRDTLAAGGGKKMTEFDKLRDSFFSGVYMYIHMG